MQFVTATLVTLSAFAAAAPVAQVGALEAAGRGLMWGAGFGAAAGAIEAGFRVHEKHVIEREQKKAQKRNAQMQSAIGQGPVIV